VNEDEVEFITLLYHQLAMHYPDLKASSQVALISPYRHQVKLLQDHFKSTFGDQSKEVIDVNTVDGFQVTSSLSSICRSALCTLASSSAYNIESCCSHAGP
jgi:hypothetical protein